VLYYRYENKWIAVSLTAKATKQVFFTDEKVFLPPDATLERGYVTVSRLSVRLSVCLSIWL